LIVSVVENLKESTLLFLISIMLKR